MELEEVLSRLQGGARRLFDSVLGSEWWMGFTKKGVFRSRGEALEGPVKKWLLRTVESLGLRRYKVVSSSYGDRVNVAVLARGGMGYMIAYVGVPDIVLVKAKGGKYVMPASMAVYYGVLAKKYATPLDFLLPRYKRILASAGFWMEAAKGRPGLFAGEAADEWHVAGSVSLPEDRLGRRLGKVKVDYEGFMFLERIGGEGPVRYDFAARCHSAVTGFVDYKARYFLLIPPLIIWKWGHTIYPDTITDKRPAREVCPL